MATPIKEKLEGTIIETREQEERSTLSCVARVIRIVESHVVYYVIILVVKRLIDASYAIIQYLI